MSLFENDLYQWRETYFVLFRENQRPSAAAINQTLRGLGPRFELSPVRTDSGGNFESVSLISPDDFSAMDICYGSGEDVTGQIEELLSEMKGAGHGPQHQARLNHLAECTARFEIYHFQQILNEDEEDEFLDPGALLIVIEKLNKLCHGISIDPQSGMWT